MPIPHDALNRWWVEASGANLAHVDALRPCMLAFMAYDPSRNASFIGSGFVVAGTPQYALAITAKHVLADGVVRVQRPNPRHSQSAIFVQPSTARPTISPSRLKAVWMGAAHANMLNVVHAGYTETLDIACCVVVPQALYADPFSPISIPFETAVPAIGNVVHMVSLGAMVVSELAPPADASGLGQALLISRSVSVRVGVVTAVYPQGFRQYQWPCFTTSIPADAGMSGGFVTLPSEEKDDCGHRDRLR